MSIECYKSSCPKHNKTEPFCEEEECVESKKIEKIKRVRSLEYNYDFDTETGKFVRWGKELADDPPFSPFGPEILDIEVSTICHGPGKPCSFCYKSNGPVGKNMSLDTYKKILDKMPDNLTQVAFGIGDLNGNPELYQMFEYTRSRGAVPNVTVNGYGISKADLDELARLCGAVAVSNYERDACYETVYQLTKRIGKKGNFIKQVNIHSLLCEETINKCYGVMNDQKWDSRLKELNAIVFLMMKPKGDRNKLHKLESISSYEKLVKKAFDEQVPIGFDSCSAPTFLKVIDKSDYYPHIKKLMHVLAEPCESDCFSSYINVDGRFFHCSFTEDEPGWEGINVLSCKDFLKDVWFAPEVVKFRNKLLDSERKNGVRTCSIFNLELS